MFLMAINVAVFALQFLTKDKLLLWGAKVSFQLMWQSLCARPSLGCQVSGHGQVFHKPGSCMSYAQCTTWQAGLYRREACVFVSRIHFKPLHGWAALVVEWAVFKISCRGEGLWLQGLRHVL